MFRTRTTRAALLPLLCALGSGAALAQSAAWAQAQSWPARPVRIVVPFSAAGTADLLTRIVADKLGAALGQAFVVEDRPGAGGIIGQESVMRAAPDGYTLVVSSLGSFVITPAFTPLPFDPFKDFTHIAYLGGQPTVMFVNKDLPQRTLPEFVAYAKAHPGEFTYATISLGSQTQLVNEMLQNEAGIQMTYVPYRGANLIVNDVLGGHLTSGSLALSAAAGQLKAGALRGLAIGTEERLPAFADIPTFKELGYPNAGVLDLVWIVGAGQPAAANRRPPQYRSGEGAACARRAGSPGKRSDRYQVLERGRLHGLLQAGGGALDADRQGGRGQGQGCRPAPP